MIILPVTEKDNESLESILTANVFEAPTLKISVYKNRRGKYTAMYLWCRADLGTCRIEPMFATDFGYNIIKINDIKIMVEEKGAF